MLCRCGHRVIGTVIWNWGICEVEYVLMCILYQCGLVIFVYGNFILVSVIQMCTMYTLVGFVLINAFYKNKWCFHFMAVVLTLILTYSFQLDHMRLIKDSLIHPNTFTSEAQFTTVPERKGALVCLQGPVVRSCAEAEHLEGLEISLLPESCPASVLCKWTKFELQLVHSESFN